MASLRMRSATRSAAASVNGSGNKSLECQPAAFDQGVRQQTRDASIAVDKRVDPREAVMAGGDGGDAGRILPSAAAVGLGEAREEIWQASDLGRNVVPNFHRLFDQSR